MLDIEGLHAGYGRAEILQGVSLGLAPGQITVLLGRNGAGKSTTMKAVIGLVRPRGGRILLRGENIAGWPPHRIAQAGLGYVPEERRIFTDLTVLENLEVGRRPARGRAAWTAARLFALFPNLAEMRNRAGGRMSGGEQQMLTIARTLMGNPDVVLLDEPSEGLAPVIVEQMARAIGALRDEGVTVLLAEQNFHFAAGIATHAAVIEKGRIVWSGLMRALQGDDGLRAAFLAV
jgi:branched-chain amino acid transport system ATP-binding protein